MSYSKHRNGRVIDDGWVVEDNGQVIAHLETEALADVLLAYLRGKMTCQLVKSAPRMRRTLEMVQDWQYERKPISDDEALNEIALALACAGKQPRKRGKHDTAG
jgi:hypothetical protein